MGVEELVIPHQIPGDGPEVFAGQRQRIGRPAVEHPVRLHELVVPDVFPELRLACRARRRPQHFERRQDHLRRHVADAVDEAIDVEIASIRKILEQRHLAEIDRRREADQILHRPVLEDRAVKQRQHAAKAIADHGDVLLAGILLHATDAIRNEVQDVVLHPKRFLFRLRRSPVQHVDVVAALQEKLDEALTRHQVEDVAAVRRGHHDQDRHAVDFIGERAVVIEVHGAADMQDVLWRRSQRRTRGRDVFHALDAALDRALHLGLDPLRERCQIETGGCVHFRSPSADGGRLVRGGRGVPARPPSPVPLLRFIWCSTALISFNWPSIDCSRSAMPTICARLGRFIATRYFSMSSPSCFCVPAATPPVWFITLENSGDAIARLAKELNPFSISPIIVCQITAGSLPLSAIGALSRMVTSACHASFVFGTFHTVAPGRSTERLSCGHRKAFCDAEKHGIKFLQRYHPRKAP